MATVTTDDGRTFEETSPRALEYYQREPGFTVGAAVADEAADLADGTIAKVLDEVGDDPQLAAQALAAETAKGDKARSTLVEKLTAITAAGAPDGGGEPTVTDVTG